MYTAVFSDRFKKDLRKLLRQNPQLKSKVYKQIERLIENPAHKSLRTHKLTGSESWSLSITMSIRLIFAIRNEKVLCTRIGRHDEVY